jgi:hypothetical protein
VPKVQHKPIKRPRKGSNKKSKRQPKAALVWRTGQCSVHQGVPLQTCHLRDFEEAAPLKFTGLSDVAPDCPVCQVEQWLSTPTVVCNATVNSEQCTCARKSQSRRQKAHRTVNMTYPVHHRTVRWPRCQKLQGQNPMAW